MYESAERPKSYRFPKLILSYAEYLYHRFLLAYPKASPTPRTV